LVWPPPPAPPHEGEGSLLGACVCPCLPPLGGEGLRVGGDRVSKARRLRKEATVPERVLWAELRQLKARGFHFRRQVAMGPYFADFACHKARLVIEVDGHLHGDESAQAYDAERTAFLEGEGYGVLRFSNGEVVSNVEGVMVVVMDALEGASETPTPSPSPQGGGEQRGKNG
jgi:very-short-patch-repair endonuclease